MAIKIKKFAAAAIAVCFLVLTVLSCAGSAAAKAANFSDIIDKDWVLEEIQIGQTIIHINRAADISEVYTIRFEADRLGGTAAPNRYFSPYTAEGANSISIGMVGSTMMAPLFERNDLAENRYFLFLEKVFRWELNNEKLELFSVDESGNEAKLIYSDKMIFQ